MSLNRPDAQVPLHSLVLSTFIQRRKIQKLRKREGGVDEQQENEKYKKEEKERGKKVSRKRSVELGRVMGSKYCHLTSMCA